MMWLHGRFPLLNHLRCILESATTPIHYLANSPIHLLDNLVGWLTTQHQLQKENSTLRQEIFLKNSELLLLEHLRQECSRLRSLLDSQLNRDERKMVAHILSIKSGCSRHQLVIDKGLLHGVYVGQPVINNKGIVGQVVTVNKINSSVLLICDETHALPVRILRNDIRLIAYGTGETGELQLETLAMTTDICPGDFLVTSGLDERFPEGYPVATVTSVEVDQQSGRTAAKAKPTASLERLRYLLLLWPKQQSKAAAREISCQPEVVGAGKNHETPPE